MQFKYNNRLNKVAFYFVVSLFVLFAFGTVFSQTVVWSEDWEGDWTRDWHVDGGTWEVGTPTSGPDSAYQGLNCAATVLTGNYSENVSTMLVRHTKFVVPPADQNPHLRFWHWFNISTDDKGFVEIKVDNNDWTQIPVEYDHTSSNKWSYTSIDLAPYAGKSIQIAFHFISKAKSYYGGTYTHVGPGWYIDNVNVISGASIFNNPETWENGLGDWSVERGTWEIGHPTYGPHQTISGINCAATVLDGKYSEWVDSRLISPKIIVPNSDQNPRFRFWQDYSFSADDKGYVEVRVGNGDWEQISADYTNTSWEWTYTSFDLVPYSNKTVQFAFHFISQAKSYYNGTYTHTSAGWYIDDVTIITGPIIFNSREGWEGGIGDWSAERGTWQIGKPTTGPNSAYSGKNCLATVLDDNYEEWVDSRFVSPKFTVPAANKNPSLRFWHWFSFSADDKGFVEIKIGDNDWQQISSDFKNTSSNVWTNTYFDLSPYAGFTVQIAFRFMSRADSYYSGTYTHVSSGWYIDNVEIEGFGESPIIDSFTATPTQGAPPLTVTFDCQAHDPDGTVASFRWDFEGDGVMDDTTETGDNIHIYETNGTFEAKCTAVDNEGNSSESKSVMIYVYSDTGRVITVSDTTITSVSKGDTIKIPIRVSEAARIAGAEIKLSFDQTIVKALYAEKSALTNDFTIADSTNEGKIAISLARATALASGSGDLVYVYFEVVTGTEDSSALAFEQVTLYDEETNSIPVTPKNGKIIIGIKHEKGFLVIDPPSDTLDVATQQQFCAYQEQTDGSITATSATWTLEKGFGNVGELLSSNGECTTLDATGPGDAIIKATSDTSAATALVVVGKTKGDINIDDLVSVPDCIRSLQYTVGNYDLSPYQLWAADMSENGSVAVNDCQLILNKTLDGMLPKTITQTGYGPATVQLGPIKQEAERVYTVPVLVNERSDVYASAFEITYDSNLLSVVTASAGKSGMIATNFKEKGMARIAMISRDGLVNSQSEILTLQFKAKSKITETPGITIREVRLFDCAAQQIVANIAESAVQAVALPKEFALHQNFPNPFNPSTMVRYDLPQNNRVSLIIYNTNGQQVRSLVNGKMSAGSHSTVWDARDDAGQIVPAGVYFYKLSVDNGSWQKTKKMILIK
ncbi:MAG: T9SS type A sorting domain-containing protein [Actinobacteria bacterium]|nr:T9SS type A sorting domain-containing protein [Actinomycetota bacterium]